MTVMKSKLFAARLLRRIIKSPVATLSLVVRSLDCSSLQMEGYENSKEIC